MKATERAHTTAVQRLVDGLWAGRFDAMASPCEVLVDGGDASQAERLTALARDEALRIERKYSRYRADSELMRWHGHGEPSAPDAQGAAAGSAPADALVDTPITTPIEVDDESAGLLDMAALCHTHERRAVRHQLRRAARGVAI